MITLPIATVVAVLPYSSNVQDTTAATTETGEPTPTYVANFGGKTVWYAGQIRNIVVDLTSKYYAKNVTVQLLKSKPDAPSNQWLTVGALTQFVPVRQSNRTTDFNFSYTFMSADVQTGKVSFKAAAMCALPTGNNHEF